MMRIEIQNIVNIKLGKISNENAINRNPKIMETNSP